MLQARALWRGTDVLHAVHSRMTTERVIPNSIALSGSQEIRDSETMVMMPSQGSALQILRKRLDKS